LLILLLLLPISLSLVTPVAKLPDAQRVVITGAYKPSALQ
jgi:hypothetical protein